MRNKYRLLKRFRFNSIFAKTFSVQLILTLLVLILSYAFIKHLYVQQYREQVFYAGFSKLSAASEKINQAIDSVTVQAQDLLQNSDCNRLLVNGNLYQDLPVLNTALRLSNLVQRNTYMKKAWLYLAQADTIIDSDKSITPRLESSEATLFGAYALQSQETENPPLLLQKGSRLYLFDHFPSRKALGIMCVLLDSEKLYAYVKPEIPNQGEIYIYYQGTPIFAQQVNYPKQSDCLISSQKNLGSGKTLCKIAGQNTGYFLTYESRIEGLTYVLQVDSSILHISWTDGPFFMIPFLAAVLLLLALASLYLIRFVYYPIQNVISSITKRADTHAADLCTGNAANELELIETIHQESEQQRITLTNMLAEVGNSVTKKLFLSILNHEESNIGRIQSILHQIRSPFPMEGMYQVLLLSWLNHAGTVPTESEKELRKILFAKMSTTYWQDKGLLCVLNDEENRETLILHFSSDCSIAKIKGWIQEYYAYIKAKAGERNAFLEVGSSRIYQNILELRHALQDAQSNLQHRVYYAKGTDCKPDILDLYRQQTEQVLHNAMKTAEPDLTELRQLIDDVRNVPEVAVQVYQNIVDLFLERLIHFDIDSKTDWLGKRDWLKEGIPDLGENDERPQAVFEFCRKALKTISSMAGKKQFRHLETAKDYIESHYSDQDLSLYTVSRSCGISSSYLSQLFVTYQPPGFLDYLNQYRMEKAKALMVTTHYTIAEIGFKTGFSSPQNFARVFKKYAMETPGQFRARHLKEQK